MSPTKTLQLSQLMLTCRLLGRFLERLSQRPADLAPIFATRAGLDPDADLRPSLGAGVALAGFHGALRLRANNDGPQPPAELVDEAFSVIAPVLVRTLHSKGSGR
jgi:hypothetical protein